MSDIIYTAPSGGGQNPSTNFIPLNNGTSSFIDSNFYNVKNDRIESFFNGFLFGLDIDYFNNETKIGDYNNVFSGNCLEIYSFNTWTKYQGNLVGIWLNFFTNIYRFGDFSNLTNGTSFYINDNNELIYTKYVGNDIGLKLDFANTNYLLGDYNVTYNGTYYLIDDNNQKMSFNTEFLNFVGAQLQSNSAGGNSGKHLVITLNGSTYKIKLENP
jgi:hypothetical protein